MTPRKKQDEATQMRTLSERERKGGSLTRDEKDRLRTYREKQVWLIFDDCSKRLTCTRLAAITGRSKPVISRFVKAGMPTRPNKTCDLTEALAWIEVHGLETEHGKLVKVAVVEKKWRKLLTWLRRGLCPACKAKVADMAKEYEG